MKILPCVISVFIVLCLLSCSAGVPAPTNPLDPANPSAASRQPVEDPPPNAHEPVVVLRAEDPNFALVALFQNHETIIAMTKTNEADQVVDVTGAIFVAPDGRSIVVYFENGLPVRAIAEGHSIEFYNFTESTVDIAIVAPDGTVTNQTNIPFDRQKIHTVSPSAAYPTHGGHLASPVLPASDADFDWIQFASTALGAFSCAATIATGGTLGILFGVSCGIFIYTSYFQITEQEPPLKVDLGDQGSGLVSCGADFVEKKYVMAAADCGKLILDTSTAIGKESTSTYEKQTKVLEEYNLKSNKKPIGRPKTCPDLTPEECVNLGKHQYHITTVVNHTKGYDPSKSCRGPFDEMRKITVSFSDVTVTTEGVWWFGKLTYLKEGPNKYISTYPDWVYALAFTPTGFTIQENENDPDYGCVWYHTFQIIP
jgi:hypothetical protein